MSKFDALSLEKLATYVCLPLFSTLLVSAYFWGSFLPPLSVNTGCHGVSSMKTVEAKNENCVRAVFYHFPRGKSVLGRHGSWAVSGGSVGFITAAFSARNEEKVDSTETATCLLRR